MPTTRQSKNALSESIFSYVDLPFEDENTGNSWRRVSKIQNYAINTLIDEDFLSNR